MVTMSLNRLFSLHQLALIEATNADHQLERKRLEAEADNIAAEIAELQKAKGAKAAGLLPAASL